MTRPWKSSIRKIPNSLRAEIDGLADNAFVLSGVRRFERVDLPVLLEHLGVSVDNQGAIVIPRFSLPDNRSATWARRNVEGGYERVLRDLPKTSRTWSYESPNFGDWSKGSHTTSWSRDVYQRDSVGPHGWVIEMEVVESTPDAVTIGFTLDHVFDRRTFHDLTLFFAANLLQESAGVLRARRSETPVDAFIATLSVDWEILPVEDGQALVAELVRRLQPSEAERTILIERVQVLSSLQPMAFITGTSGFARYVGAQFDNGAVVFENLRYGNAAYIMFENWQELSQRSRVDLIGSAEDFVRIPHRTGWQQRLRRAVRDIRR